MSIASIRAPNRADNVLSGARYAHSEGEFHGCDLSIEVNKRKKTIFDKTYLLEGLHIMEIAGFLSRINKYSTFFEPKTPARWVQDG